MNDLTEQEMDIIRVRITQHVDEWGGSQTKAARELGISQQSISKIVAGGPPGLEVARRLADYDDVPLSHYVFEVRRERR